MAALSTLALIGLGLAAGGAVYQGVEAHKAASQAEDQANQQKADQDKLLADEKKKQTEQETLAKNTQIQSENRSRQKTLAAGAYGRGGTIISGPTGVPVTGQAPPQGAYKTLLGQ